MIDTHNMQALIAEKLHTAVEVRQTGKRSFAVHIDSVDKDEVTLIEKLTESEWTWIDDSKEKNYNFVINFTQRENKRLDMGDTAFP